MSAGAFRIAKYQSSYDVAAIHPIRLQPESFASGVTGAISTNTEPSAAVNRPISAKVSMNSREVGLKPRTARLRLQAGQTPPTGYGPNGTAVVPILSQTVWDGTAFQKQATVNYLGVNWTVVGRSPEIVR